MYLPALLMNGLFFCQSFASLCVTSLNLYDDDDANWSFDPRMTASAAVSRQQVRRPWYHGPCASTEKNCESESTVDRDCSLRNTGADTNTCCSVGVGKKSAINSVVN